MEATYDRLVTWQGNFLSTKAASTGHYDLATSDPGRSIVRSDSLTVPVPPPTMDC